MNHYTFSWRTQDGLKIFGERWLPPNPKAIVCLVHGLGEHSGRYLHLARFYNEAGLGVVVFDHRGHGQSEGKRGYVPAYEALMDDIGHLLSDAQREFAQLPHILYGHSMGGNLTLNYVLRRRPDVAGVVVTAPWLQLTHPPPAIQLKLINGLSRLWPALTVPNQLDPTALSRDPQVVNAYKTDPLVHDRISLRLFAKLNQSGEWALSRAASFHLPLLLIHGDADRLTSAAASRQFAARAPNCTLKLWPRLYHEPHNEPEQKAVFTYVLDWVEGLMGHELP